MKFVYLALATLLLFPFVSAQATQDYDMNGYGLLDLYTITNNAGLSIVLGTDFSLIADGDIEFVTGGNGWFRGVYSFVNSQVETIFKVDGLNEEITAVVPTEEPTTTSYYLCVDENGKMFKNEWSCRNLEPMNFRSYP